MLQPNRSPIFRRPTPESLDEIIRLQDSTYGERSSTNSIVEINQPRLVVVSKDKIERHAKLLPLPSEFDEEMTLKVLGLRMTSASRRQKNRDGLNLILESLPERAYFEQGLNRRPNNHYRELLLISHTSPSELSVDALARLVKSNLLPDHITFQAPTTT